jgi:hypothetical protein
LPKRPRRIDAIRVAAWVLLPCLALAGCYVPSAARRSGRMVADAWDRDAHGNKVFLTGPGMSLLAVGDFAVHALVPIHYDGYFLVDRNEPDEKWFRFYDGPMQPLEKVAILCNRERATHVTTIRTEGHERATYARHRKWHYPQCIEVLPGTYELTVDFYSRETFRRDFSVATYSTESTSPATVVWSPGPDEVYELTAVLGDVAPAPGAAYKGTTLKRLTRTKTNLGASEFTLDEGHWLAIVEKVASLDHFDAPVLEQREAWRRYELRRRDR